MTISFVLIQLDGRILDKRFWIEINRSIYSRSISTRWFERIRANKNLKKEVFFLHKLSLPIVKLGSSKL